MALRTLSAVAISGLALSACASGPDPETLGPLAFMVGCWRSADGLNTEEWSAPQGGVMFGHATTMQNGQLAFFEQSRIDLRQGNAVYTASPQGQRPTDFVAPRNALSAAGVAFENPQHDYPQKINYRPNGKKGLAATISLLDGSRPTEYAWVRCE